MTDKIYSLKKLSELLRQNNFKKKKIVLCHGVFDLLHIGHIKHLEKAKNFGDKLVVTITADKFVNKGPGRPAFNENLRSEAIASIGVVDYVAINDSPTAETPIKYLRPNVYCKGKDYKNSNDDITGEIKNEIKELKKNDGKIVFTEELTFSSSRLINRSTNFFSSHQKKKLSIIRKKNDFKSIKKTIDEFKNLKILTIGETIIDKYNFCEAIGKSGKEPILVLKDSYEEKYFGGVLSIAKNLANFSKNVSVLSMLGEKKNYLAEINKFLSKNIKKHFIFKKNSPTIVKKRYVDHVTGSKLFGIYNFNDDILNKQNETEFNKKIVNLIKKSDLIIVSDYGHGLISEKSAKLICKHSKFLALNAQVNAANIGYHTIRNYNNFNTLIINEKEIRHEMRDKITDVKNLMKKLSNEKNIKNLIVTRGGKGSILYNKFESKFFYCDGYATSITDKIGAGDTMLSLIAPCLKKNIDFDTSLLISSLAAAQSIENYGNKYSIKKLDILKTLENIFK